jgi:hypothetical protein
MRYFEIILEFGHVGAGKSYDAARFVKARDIMEAFERALVMPGAKKKRFGADIKRIKEISQTEFVNRRTN